MNETIHLLHNNTNKSIFSICLNKLNKIKPKITVFTTGGCGSGFCLAGDAASTDICLSDSFLLDAGMTVVVDNNRLTCL